MRRAVVSTRFSPNGVAAVILLVMTAAAATGILASSQQPAEKFPGVLDEHPAIQYAGRPTRDRVARLNQRLADGAETLTYDATTGYLRALLDALDVPSESQLLVFSKTGLQRAATSPRNPRALYFNDSVVVGYIAGAPALEVAVQAPEQGVVFYTLDQAPSAGPALVRRTNCLTCHVSSSTLEVPGMIVRSNATTETGELLPQLGHTVVDHRTPVTERWGGWFVTGNYTRHPYGGVAHKGNVTIAMHPTSGPAATSNEIFINWTGAAERTGYISTGSDVVALMLFDHQMRAMNLLTRLNWEARVAAAEGEAGATPAVRSAAGDLVDYFLFVDEVQPPGTLTPSSAFVERFSAAAVRDRRNRSLRDLELSTRLLRYRCSYMIHSAAFDNLPPLAKQIVLEQLAAVLSGRDRSSKYAYLDGAERAAILEILGDTKPELRDALR